MVDWKLYIDAPQKRALDLCRGSLTEGDGYGYGWGWGYGRGWGDGYGYGDMGGTDAKGDGNGVGHGWDGYSNGNGRSLTEW